MATSSHRCKKLCLNALAATSSRQLSTATLIVFGLSPHHRQRLHPLRGTLRSTQHPKRSGTTNPIHPKTTMLSSLLQQRACVTQPPPEAPDVAAGGVDVGTEPLPTLRTLLIPPLPSLRLPLCPTPRLAVHPRPRGGNALTLFRKPGCAWASRLLTPSTCSQPAVNAPSRCSPLLPAPGRSANRHAHRPEADDEVRGWKLFVLAPRMLPYRSPGEARVPPTELDRRVELFLTAEPLAPGTSDTLAELRDPARRPSEPYAPLAEATLRHAPDHPCPLPQLAFLECLRSARRVDAVGAFDHVARGAMLDALLANPALQPLLPYARQFYASPSTYTWYDEDGAAHNVHQGEGGEQGDPLMPAFYAHPALHDLHTQLQDGEAVFAFLDDVYVVAPPERVRVLYDALAAALWAHARIRLHEGK
eukprot:s14575_g1.t1